MLQNNYFNDAVGLIQKIPANWHLTNEQPDGKMNNMNISEIVGAPRKPAGSHFPYKDSTVTYLIAKNSKIFPIEIDRTNLNAVVNSEHTLYAVWPGQNSSDLFLVDKVALVKAFQ